MRYAIINLVQPSLEWLRRALVYGCAAALIAAGPGLNLGL